MKFKCMYSVSSLSSLTKNIKIIFFYLCILSVNTDFLQLV